MTYEVVLTAKAERQMEEAVLWWAKNRSPNQAQRWYLGLSQAIASLEANPERWPLAREADSFPIPIRQLSYGLGRNKTHRVLFLVRPNRVVVYAIRHLAQQDVQPDDL